MANQSPPRADEANADGAGPPAHLVLWIAPAALATIIPALWFTSADRPFAFRPDLFVSMSAIVVFCALLILFGLARFSAKPLRWSLGVTAVVVVVGFLWRPFTTLGTDVALSLGVAWLADIVPVTLAAALIWLSVRLADDLPFAIILGAGTALTVAWLGAINLGLVAPAAVDAEASADADGAAHVLLIVLDGYGRQDQLADVFGTDISDFVVGLEKRGFIVPSGATANYGYTYAAVSSMLNLDYVLSPGEITGEQLTTMRAALTGATGLMAEFRAAGYDTAYIENAWGGSQCGSAIDWCIRDGLAKRSLWNLGRMTILAPLVEELWADPFNDISIDHLESLGTYATEPASDGRPRFMFAHFILPHAPMRLDADCTRLPGGQLTDWGPQPELVEARRANYRSQLRCVNRLVLEALDEFIAMHPDGVVMITSDHGPGSTLDPNLGIESLSPATLTERMNIFSAYRMPGCESLVRQDLTPVNGSRALANCVLELGLDDVPDLNLWADLDGTGHVTDITRQVARSASE